MQCVKMNCEGRIILTESVIGSRHLFIFIYLNVYMFMLTMEFSNKLK